MKRLFALLAIVAFAVSPAWASDAPAPKEQATRGNVTASLFYEIDKTEVPWKMVSFRIHIARGGVVLLDEVVPPHPKYPSYGVGPAGYGQSRSIFVRDLDADGEPEVLLDLYWGGAHCCFWSRVYRYDAVANVYRVSLHFWGNPSYRLRDLNGDSRPEFVTGDNRFAYRFAAFAFSGLPIRIWSYTAGRFTNVTRRFPRLIAQDASAQWRAFVRTGRKYHEVRGFLAAWAADEYSLGHVKKVNRTLNASLRRGELDGDIPRDPHAYLRALKRFLRSTGYLRG